MSIWPNHNDEMNVIGHPPEVTLGSVTIDYTTPTFAESRSHKNTQNSSCKQTTFICNCEVIPSPYMGSMGSVQDELYATLYIYIAI